ncbi:MAG: hypothetical protein N2559_11845, partial [Anaerolineae bacterium]|nr:hypothetical protein [Anaerolineae bacterium]
IGAITSGIAGAIAAWLGGLWLIIIFYAPAAATVIAEIIRRAIQKRRGKYIALVACAVFIIGGFIGAGALVFFTWGGWRFDLTRFASR